MRAPITAFLRLPQSCAGGDCVCAQDMPIVVDADGLALVVADPQVLKGYRKAVLTPNAPEFWRLADALKVDHGKKQPMDNLPALQVQLTRGLYCHALAICVPTPRSQAAQSPR